jgi:glycerate 2-kinase
MPRVVCAPDKFRDGLSAALAARAMAGGAALAGWSGVEHPVADGGEGSAEAVLASRAGTRHAVATCDALGRPAMAGYARFADAGAIVVAADVIGLEQLPVSERDPLRASSRGLAAPIMAAVAAGARRVIVFVGGTANMDGGIGLLAALGAEVVDRDGVALNGSGADLAAVARLDLAPARRALGSVELILASDVDSALYGATGAAHVFGPQKGADASAVERLDAGLRRLAPMLGPAALLPGAGAAGGLGAALMALGATRTSGARLVLELSGFAEQLAGAALCITGEGAVDPSSAAGKAVSAVLQASADAGVPCVVLGGSVATGAETLYEHGAAGIFAIGRRPRPLAEALAATAADLGSAVRAVCTLAARMRAQP